VGWSTPFEGGKGHWSKGAGQWKYLYRAVDRAGDTIDFLLRAKRDRAAARKFLERSIALHGEPDKIIIDKSGANTAAIASYNAEHEADIELRQSKYLNNIVEQDHRAIKRIARPMLGFKSFRCASILIAGIETMHMIRKGQTAPKAKPCPRQFSSTPWQSERWPTPRLRFNFTGLLRQNPRPRWLSGALSLPNRRLGLGKLRNPQAACRYSDIAGGRP
jgi:hypothetical protein